MNKMASFCYGTTASKNEYFWTEFRVAGGDVVLSTAQNEQEISGQLLRITG